MDIHEVTKALWDEVKAYNGGNGTATTQAAAVERYRFFSLVRFGR